MVRNCLVDKQHSSPGDNLYECSVLCETLTVRVGQFCSSLRVRSRVLLLQLTRPSRVQQAQYRARGTMESAPHSVMAKKKTREENFDLKLPDFIRVDWKRPTCYCQGSCNCSSFKCRMTYKPGEPPEDRAIDTKEEKGIDWSQLLNIDLLNLTWRRAKSSDFDEIFQLSDDYTQRLFEIDDSGEKIARLIEHSYCFVVAVNFQGAIVGAVSVNDTPPLSYMAEAEWDTWIQSKYGAQKFRCYNTLWIHFMAYKQRYRSVILYNILGPIFRLYHLVTKLTIYVPNKVKFRASWGCHFEQVGTTMKPKKEEHRLEVDSDAEEYPTNIFCISRRKVFDEPTLSKLNTNDSDQLYRVFVSCKKKLTKKYGANHINEISENKKAHVFIGTTANPDDQPAILILMSDADLEALRDKFELFAFNNFRKNKATDYLMQPEQRYISAISQEIVEISEVNHVTEGSKAQEQDEGDDQQEHEDKDDEEGDVMVVEGLTWTNFLMTGTQDSDEEEGRGMDKILCSDNPIDRITYKNLCMAMSSCNLTQNLKVNTSRKTQTIFSNDEDGSCNAVSLDFLEMGSVPPDDVRRFFSTLLDHFTEFDYIIMTMPKNAKHPSCVRYMMRVWPKGYKSYYYIEQELFFVHRWFFSGSAECRKAVKADFQCLLNVLCIENTSEEIQRELFETLFGEKLRNTAVVFSINKKIVGAAIVSPERDMEFYKFNYDLDSIMNAALHSQSQIGYIKHMVVNGLHESRTRDFVRGFMQFMGWKSVFFARYPNYLQDEISDFSLLSGIKQFVPVPPRRVPRYCKKTTADIPPYFLRNDYPPFALYYLNYRLASFPKIMNHTRIVVVGTGETGLSFLENLIFRSTSGEEMFTEIVVITNHHNALSYPRRMRLSGRKRSAAKSEDHRAAWLNILKQRLDKSNNTDLDGYTAQAHYLFNAMKPMRESMPTETTHKSVAERMVPQSGRFSAKYICKLGLDSWVRVVEGTMTGIHREEKCVQVDRKKIIPYDYLFLFCGRQFCTPQADTRNIILRRDCQALYDLKTPWIERVTLKPKNLFTINCLSDASNALQYIKRTNPGSGHLIVYGSSVNCLSCIDALLHFGVDPARIAFVESELKAPYAIDYFNDPVVYKAVSRRLHDIGITHHNYYNFVNWDYSEEMQTISKAHFESDSKMVSLKCSVFFSFSPKAVACDTLLAYVNSNLVFDERLVVDSSFRTNDRFIYAAGPGTKYKKAYFADHYFHEHYNSSEVGAEMANRAFQLVSNLPREELPVHGGIIDFKKPVVTVCRIPKGQYLLMVRRPGPIVPLEALISQLDFLSAPNPFYVEQGHILVTGNPNSVNVTEPGYFKIILNDQNNLIDIVCLSPNLIDVVDIVQLYGRHESLLNNLLTRHKSGFISDFYEFFKQPWAYIIFHERFNDLVETLKDNFYTELPNSDKKFIDLIAEALKDTNWTKLPDDSKSLLRQIFLSFPQLKNKCALQMRQFFEENRNQLPMAMNQEFMRSLMRSADESFLYMSKDGRAGEKPLVSKPIKIRKKRAPAKKK